MKGHRLLDENFVTLATSRLADLSVEDYGYGYLWWVTPFAGLDAYSAVERFGQLIIVVPARELAPCGSCAGGTADDERQAAASGQAVDGWFVLHPIRTGSCEDQGEGSHLASPMSAELDFPGVTLVDDDKQDAHRLPSFRGLSGEEDFRARIVGITVQVDPTGEWLQALAPVLRQLIDYDAVWLGRWDVAARRYRPLLENGDVEPLRELFANDVAASDIEQLGFLQPGWAHARHRILPLLTQLRGWNEYLAPAGFRDGVGVGLRTSDGRHVGYLPCERMC